MRTSLEQERISIRARLDEIEGVLGNPTATVASAAPTPAAPRVDRTPNRRVTAPRRATRSGQLTMRDAIAAATQRGPVGISDLVPAVKKLGYKFTSKNPVNSLGAYLYGPAGKEHFRRVDGGFIPR